MPFIVFMLLVLSPFVIAFYLVFCALVSALVYKKIDIITAAIICGIFWPLVGVGVLAAVTYEKMMQLLDELES